MILGEKSQNQRCMGIKEVVKAAEKDSVVALKTVVVTIEAMVVIETAVASVIEEVVTEATVAVVGVSLLAQKYRQSQKVGAPLCCQIILDFKQ